MILDKLEHAMDYAGLSDNFRKAFEYLTSNDLSALPTGRYEIDGEKVFMMVQECALKPWAEGRWEAHRRYADIQTVIAGAECIGFRMHGEAEVSEPYSAERDILFCDGDAGDCAVLHEGDFLVLLPQDDHRPCIRPAEGIDKVRKAVVKVEMIG